jgi:predicted RNA binding protein YcfA (HicA-like mRNA interferase family)
MPSLPAPAAEPRHTCGGAGGAAVTDEPAWYRQKVKVPKRVWGTGRYSPGAVAWHAQITALQRRPERCRASVATLAGWMGDGKRTGERYLAELHAPGPDGIPELTTIRHTDSAGDGETAERFTRALTRDEHFAYVAVLAAKTLRHPLFVLYCALAYADATNTPVTMAELAELLGVTEMTARRMVNELERLGWITVHRRTGAHGRHEYEVHDQPLHPVPSTPDEPGPVSSDGGSGACADGGSLAIKEDTGLTDGRSTDRRGSFRRRRGDRSKPAAPVDNSRTPVASVAPATFRPAPSTPVRPQDGRCYDGPPLTLSPRVWAVLEPVHDLLPTVGAFMVRRIAREVGRQLDAGIWPEDIRDQLARLRRWTGDTEIRDPGRWIYGAALPARPGRCGRPECHYGFLPHTGMPCKACADHAGRSRGHPPHTPPQAPAQQLLECPGCAAPYRPPLRRPSCRLCHTTLPNPA